jgi:hypothetical protein
MNPRIRRRGRSLGFALRSRDDRVDPIAVQAADRRAVKQSGRGKRAIAEAVNRFDVERGIVVLVANLDAMLQFKMRNEVLASQGLTGFGAAKL